MRIPTLGGRLKMKYHAGVARKTWIEIALSTNPVWRLYGQAD
jgi:hypothetical protein